MSEEPHESDRSTTHRDPPVGDDRAGRTSLRSAVRAVAALSGGALLVRGLRGRADRSGATALLGAALLVGALVDAVRHRGGRARHDDAEPGATGAEASATAPEETAAGRTDRAGTASVSRSVTVDAPAEELYELWRDPELFSRTMGHVADVTTTDGERYAWSATGPTGREFSWETVVVDAEPGERLEWATTPEATLPVAATVDFRPARGDRGTVVTLTVTADPPGGRIGGALLDRLGLLPEMLVGRALARFKSLAESGEIPTLDTNPSGRGRGDLL